MGTDSSSKTALSVLFAIALVVANIAVLCFYVLWQIADTAAVNRSEAQGFDTSQLLPHSNLMWVAANVSLVGILAVDVLAIIIALAATRRPRRIVGTAARLGDSS